MTVARIEELVGVTAKVTQTFDLVLHSVRVDDIHDDSDTQAVGLIDKGFQLLGRTETT